MVREHEPGYAVRVGQVGRLLGESDLDGSWTPGDELGEVTLADAEERFMYLLYEGGLY